MSLHGLYPFAGNHAIQSAVFAIEWPTELTEIDLRKLRPVVDSLRSDFPNIQEQRLVTLNVTPGVAQSNEARVEALGGFMLTRPSTLLTGTSRTMALNRSSCVINLSDYTRWDKALSDVQRYLNVLLPAIDRPLNVLGLQYLDVFMWRDKPEKLNLSEVFRAESKFLPANVFALPGLWHSHHGYFDDAAEPVLCRQLDNINVSRAENEGGHLIQVLTSHRINFAELLWDKTANKGETIVTLLERMHDRNKEILKDLLSPAVQELVQLNKKQEVQHV